MTDTEKTTGVLLENFFEDTPTPVFSGNKTYRGKPTKTYQAFLKKQHELSKEPLLKDNKPPVKHELDDKIINPVTGRFVNKAQFIDQRNNKPKAGYDIVNGKLTNKPSSKSSYFFTPTVTVNKTKMTPELSDVGLSKDTTGLYFFKIYRLGKQVGEGQIDFEGNENNRINIFNLFSSGSDTYYLKKDIQYRIDVFEFNNLKFDRQKVPQIYAENTTKTCIIEPIMKYLKEHPGKTNDKKLKTCENLIKKFPDGMSSKDIQTKICNTLKFAVRIITPTNAVVEHIRPKDDPKKTFTYCNTVDNHAETWTFADWCSEDKEIIEVHTATEMDDIYTGLRDDNVDFLFRTSTRIQGYNGVCMIETKDIKYTLHDPLLELKNELFKKKDVFSSMRLPYKDFEGSVIEFIQSATYVNGMMTFSQCEDRTNLKEHDIKKAYASFHECDYYKDYGLPSVPTDYRDCTGQDTLTVISKIGWTQIYDIEANDCNAFKLANLQEMYVYPNVELKCLYDMGVRFKCKTSAWCLTKRDFTFGKDYLENINHPDFLEQKPYAIIIGMMLTTSTKQTINYHYSSEPSEEWVNNITYCDEKISKVWDNRDEQIMIFKKDYESVKSFCHVSSYITAYVRTRMYKEINNRDISDLVMVKSDALKFIGDYYLPNGYREKLTDIYLTTADWCAYHNEKAIKSEWQCDEWADMGQFVFLNGAGGTGKTTTYLRKKYPFNVLAMPTNELKAEKKRESGKPTYTHHNFFKLPVCGDEEKECHGLQDWEYYGIGECFVDEITMRKRLETDLMIEHAKAYGYRIYFVGDIDFDTQIPYQLQPVKCKFSFDATLFKDVIHYTKNYRVKDEKLLKALTRIRKMMLMNMDKDVSHPFFIKSFTQAILKKHEIVDAEYMWDNYKKGDMVITGRNANKNIINECLDKIHTEKQIKLTRKVDKYEKGTIMLESDLEIKTKCTELCFATSIHGVQGKTCHNTLFINVDDNFEFGMLYTAMSRVRFYNQIVLFK